MKNLTLVFKLLMMAILISGVTACSKKGSKGASMRDRRSQQVDARGVPVKSPQANANTNCPDCGYIYGGTSGNFQAAAVAFLNLADPSELGYLSPQQAQSTGIFFQGNVSGNSGNSLSGHIKVVVWDDIANQPNGAPYVVNLALQTQASNSDLKTSAHLVFADDFGVLVLDGNFTSQGTFTGTASFSTNNSNQLMPLGNFITGDCNFISAGCN